MTYINRSIDRSTRAWRTKISSTLIKTLFVVLLSSSVIACEGPVGPQGQRGNTGAQGEIGPRGEIGPQGERGLQGERGERGEQGPQGEVGPRGEQGPQGERGPRGERGPAGGTGDWSIFSVIIEFDKNDIAITQGVGIRELVGDISFSVQEIDQDVFERGTVDVFIETDDGWTALPSDYDFRWIFQNILVRGRIEIR